MNNHNNLIFALLMGSTISIHAMDDKKCVSTFVYLTTPPRTYSVPQQIPNATATQHDETFGRKNNVLNRSSSTPRAGTRQESANDIRSQSYSPGSFSQRDADHLQHVMNISPDATTSTDSSPLSSRNRSRHSSYSFESGYDSDQSCG